VADNLNTVLDCETKVYLRISLQQNTMLNNGASLPALHGPVAPAIQSRGRHDASAGDRHVSGPMSSDGLQRGRRRRLTFVSSADRGRRSGSCARSYDHFAATPPSSHAHLQSGIGSQVLLIVSDGSTSFFPLWLRVGLLSFSSLLLWHLPPSSASRCSTCTFVLPRMRSCTDFHCLFFIGAPF